MGKNTRPFPLYYFIQMLVRIYLMLEPFTFSPILINLHLCNEGYLAVEYFYDYVSFCSSKLKRDSSPNFENIVQQDQLIKQKDDEVQTHVW